MAVDEALMTCDSPPTLRLYGWNPHAVSLGYFQRAGPFAARIGGIPLVRRLTGGGAIHHAHEQTFSLALPLSSFPPDVRRSYLLVHGAIVRALSRVGVEASIVERGRPHAARPSSDWCFAGPGAGDIAGPCGRKLLGSAQRRIRWPEARVLHHGSLVLRRSDLTPFTAAVSDQVDPGAVLEPLCSALIEEIAACLGMSPSPGSLTDRETSAARTLRRDRYLAPGFTFAR